MTLLYATALSDGLESKRGCFRTDTTAFVGTLRTDASGSWDLFVRTTSSMGSFWTYTSGLGEAYTSSRWCEHTQHPDAWKNVSFILEDVICSRRSSR